ncbi:MAG: hypothetical protein LBC83_05950 [Oscillospiraceae bacterium]|jgi:pimeloyl-ACP methyl ester carboxylesterase|nr:hypothetical protein [Oscillospiraceae bacterium]
MKTVICKGLAWITAAALLLGCLATGPFAAGSESCACAEIPRVYIEGIGAPLRRNAGTAAEEQVDVADTAHIQEALLPMARSILKAVALHSWEAGADAIASLAYSLFGHLQCDERGKSIAPISNPYAAPTQDHRQDKNFGFRYDWRLDPMESARQLHEYIQLVRALTGHEKVALLYFSEGGLVATAYLAQFGSDAIDHLVPIMSAHNGLTLLGELFSKNLHLSAPATANLIRSLVTNQGGAEMDLVAALVTVLEQAGLLEALTGALQVLLDNAGDRIYEAALIPLFVQWPALWGFVPDRYYESAKAAVLADNKHVDFIRTIDDYHYNAGAKADALLAEAAANGTKVSIVASYGFPSMPFFSGANVSADGLIDTALESSGATCADNGQTLGARYTQKIDDGQNHISPNRQIDASTCAFLNQTWFLQDQIHFTFAYPDFIDFLIYSDAQPTITSDANYPQFITRLPDNTFIPSTQAPAKPPPAAKLWLSLWSFARFAFELLASTLVG